MFFSTHILLIAISFSAACVRATPLSPRAGDVLHEKRAPNAAWKRARRMEAHVNVPLRIGLKQSGLDDLPAILMSVSDPDSPTYGHHWEPERVNEAFAPSQGTKDAVRGWLASSGFQGDRVKLSKNQAWIEVDGISIGDVERLLNTEYHVYEHENGDEHIACHSYYLPKHMVDHIDIITPTIQPNIKLTTRGNSRRNLNRRSPPSATSAGANQLPTSISAKSQTGCDVAVTPDCLRSLYNMTYTPRATDRNSFGILNHASNGYLQSDLDMFFRNFSPSLVGKSPVFVSIDGGTNDTSQASDFGEAGWILQYAMSLTQPQPVSLLQVGGPQTDPQSLPRGLKQHDCGTIRSPNVLSQSSADHEYRLSPFYTHRQCNEFGKLGLMGVTILYPAGNTGVAGTTLGYCLDDNGWPASCPWVTAVGGTQVRANASTTQPGAEEVWNQDMTMGFFESGGGGFSNRFPTAAYQQKAVDTYLQQLKKTDPESLKHFNSKGRAYPDLSANANMFVSIDNGSVSISSGTSGATPTIGAIITLVNDARIAAGKKPVGFINPTIYSPGFAGAFNDITSGTNQGCKGLQGDRKGGFTAGPGWDPASGLGTPNLGVMIEKWLALP
ncbi:peptidase S8/S53 domain-containing protein [Infundibulicybe gibba]|nr:peptidase S8/S53 domain-containing protein [Infundibulicybe gibba]